MESSLRNTAALIGHVNKLERQLLSRYLNIVSLARLPLTNRAPEQDDEPHLPDRNQAAYNTLKMDIETAGLVRAAEDILTLTRQMKELWLFGQLHTLGTSSVQEKTEEDARAVGNMLGDLLEKLYAADGASVAANGSSNGEIGSTLQDERQDS